MNIPRVANGALRAVFESLTRPTVSQIPISPLIKGVGHRPESCKMGLVKLTFATVASLYLGGLIAQKGASYLEENEIFVPSDDDDDDD